MTTTLIIIGIFAGFFFLVVRPLQKRSGKYDVELPERDSDPTWASMPGNFFHTINDKDR
ncbi:MAG: hypothetical protein M0Z48_10240 [Nitrospiraceae bacterium]|nr:hypothetical protein [Nitrospiraceae bacterium]